MVDRFSILPKRMLKTLIILINVQKDANAKDLFVWHEGSDSVHNVKMYLRNPQNVARKDANEKALSWKLHQTKKRRRY